MIFIQAYLTHGILASYRRSMQLRPRTSSPGPDAPDDTPPPPPVRPYWPPAADHAHLCNHPADKLSYAGCPRWPACVALDARTVAS